jgi:hypothetical protein
LQCCARSKLAEIRFSSDVNSSHLNVKDLCATDSHEKTDEASKKKNQPETTRIKQTSTDCPVCHQTAGLSPMQVSCLSEAATTFQSDTTNICRLSEFLNTESQSSKHNGGTRREQRLTGGARRWQDACPILQQMQSALSAKKNTMHTSPPSLPLPISRPGMHLLHSS